MLKFFLNSGSGFWWILRMMGYSPEGSQFQSWSILRIHQNPLPEPGAVLMNPEDPLPEFRKNFSIQNAKSKIQNSGNILAFRMLNQKFQNSGKILAFRMLNEKFRFRQILSIQ